MALQLNKDQTLFMIRQLMSLINIEDYTNYDNSWARLEVSGDISEGSYIIKVKRTPDNISPVRAFNIRSYKNFLSIYAEGDGVSYLDFNYNFTWRSFSKVHREFIRHYKPFLKKMRTLIEEREEKKQEEGNIEFNNRVTQLFPCIVDSILLGVEDDK